MLEMRIYRNFIGLSSTHRIPDRCNSNGVPPVLDINCTHGIAIYISLSITTFSRVRQLARLR